MKEVSLRDLAAWCGALNTEELPDVGITSVSRNTQTLRPGALFVPLRGAKADGHDYIPAAVLAGASAALCDRGDVSSAVPLVRVEDTRAAAQAMAAGYRGMMGRPVIGITGSAGKTTTCAMVRAVLERKFRMPPTLPDDNGQIGLTFAVFNLEDCHDLAVWEMGMSQYGEMQRLSEMVRPDAAVINGIGTAHIEFFGSRERILDAKLEILSGMRRGAPLILNGDDDLLWGLRGTLEYRTIYYALENPEADIRGEITAQDSVSQTLRIRFPDGTVERRLPAAGRHNAQNALAAAAVGHLLGLAPGEISFDGFRGVGGRQNIVQKYGMTVMEDWYNASPEAVCAALDVLSTLGGRRFAALGCMRELGEASGRLHRQCGARAAKCADALYVYGEGAEAYLEGARDAGMPETALRMYGDRDALAQDLAREVSPGDSLLFKGSHHFTHMERCMERFYALMEENNG